MDLLDEIWILIFREHLDVLDAVRCRKVSKRFKFLIDQLRPSELFIYSFYPHSLTFTYRYERAPTIWWQCRKAVFNLEPNCSFYILFANLRFFQLDMSLYKKDSPIEVFNGFFHLEKLYLNRVVIARSQTLKLPRLKVLSIALKSDDEHEHRDRYGALDYDRQPRLVIDCKLEELLGARSNLIVLNHPECIQHLEIPFRPGMKLEELNLFPNLRTLHSPLTEALLSAFHLFDHLEELHLDENRREVYGGERAAKEQQVKQLLNKSAVLKKKTKIYLNHILVTKSEEPVFRRTFHEKVRFYHRLAECVRVQVQIDYRELALLLNDPDTIQELRRNQIELERGLPKDFFCRFPSIKLVRVSSTVGDTEWLAWFLAKCTRLVEFEIERKFLTQPLLDQLPVATRNLRKLSIYQPHDSPPNSRRLDLSPLYELRQLCFLQLKIDDAGLDSPFDLDILLEKCRYLVNIYLKHIAISLDDKTGLFMMFTRRGAQQGSNLVCSNLPFRAIYGKAELQSKLDTILQECRV